MAAQRADVSHGACPDDDIKGFSTLTNIAGAGRMLPGYRCPVPWMDGVGPAVQHIGAVGGSVRDGVVSRITAQQIIPVIAVRLVVSGITKKEVIAIATLDRVGPTGAPLGWEAERRWPPAS